jgi:hypothetical protein
MAFRAQFQFLVAAISSIHVSSMSNPVYLDDSLRGNLIHDAVIANADSERALRVAQLLRTMRKWFLREALDCGQNSRHLLFWKIAQVFLGGTAPANLK